MIAVSPSLKREIDFTFLVLLQKKVEKEMADAEVQLELSNQEYNVLHKKLEDMLTTIAREAKDIRKLEQELKEGGSESVLREKFDPRC